MSFLRSSYLLFRTLAFAFVAAFILAVILVLVIALVTALITLALVVFLCHGFSPSMLCLH